MDDSKGKVPGHFLRSYSLMPSVVRRKPFRLVLTVIILAQPATAQVARSTFPVSLGSGAVVGLPFDEPFVLTSSAPKELREVRVWVAPRSALDRADCHSLRPPAEERTSGGDGLTTIDLTVPRANAQGLEHKAKQDVATAEARLRAVVGKRTSSARLVTVLRGVIQELTGQVNQTIPSLPEFAQLIAIREIVSTVLNHELQTLRRIQADITREDAALYSARLALALAPHLITAPTWRWKSDKSLDSVNGVTLNVGRLEPNTDYTFCYQLVQVPTKDDSMKFVSKALANLTTTVREIAALPMGTVEQLDAIQLALLSSIPDADSIVVTKGSVFDRPTSSETDEDKKKRLNRLVLFYADYAQHFDSRNDDIVSADRHANDVDAALRRIAGSADALQKLSLLARDLSISPKGKPEYAAGAAMARKLGFLKVTATGYFADVARGAKHIDDVTGNHPGRDLTKFWTSEPIKVFDAALQRSVVLADSVRDLARFALANPVLIAAYAGKGGNLKDSVRIFRDSLKSIESHVTEFLSTIDIERGDLANLITAIESMNTGVQKLAATVASVDFANIALQSSTAVTNQARAMTYISLDAGLLGGYQVREVVPYFGVNLYFRPVNKNMHLPLPWRKGNPVYFSRRIALTLGVTAASIKQANRLDDLFNSHAILLGTGVRLHDYWRVTVGGLFFKSYDDKVSKRSTIVARPAAGTSLDLDILGALGKVGAFLIPNLK